MKSLPFQRDDGRWLRELKRRALWSEPGTGKTLSAAEGLREINSSLIVAPAAAVVQWVRVLQDQGMDARAILPGDSIRVPLARHTVISWGLLGRGLAGEMAARKLTFEAAVLDESHKAVRDTAQRTVRTLDLIKRVTRVWPLTGTPMIRYADDLWPLCNALWPKYLDSLGIRSESGFRRRFCTMRNGFVTGSRQFTLRTLHEVLEGGRVMPAVVRRRTLAEVAPLMPPVTSRVYELPLTGDERRRVNAELPKDILARLEAADATLDGEAHIATARRALGILKAPSAAELALDAPGKVIVIYWHHEVGDLLQLRLGEQVPLVRLDGATPMIHRQPIVDAFNKPAGPKVFLLQMQAGGEAINPHEECSHLLFAERDWSGAVMDQALRRVRRMGQTRHQQVDFLDTDHPLDVAMRRVAGRKMRDLGVLTGDAA